MRGAFWMILATSLLLASLVALGLAPWGAEGNWTWPYAVPALQRFWPFMLLALMGVALLVGVERHLSQCQARSSPTIALIGLALLAIGLQLSAMRLVNPNPLSELWRRTVSPASGGYYNVAATLDNWPVLLRQFPELMPHWDAHPQRHPPGLILLFVGWRLLLERLPGLARALADPIRLDQCQHSALMFYDNAQLATAWIGVVLPVLSSVLLVWPVYWLGKSFYNARVGGWAAAWVPLLPTLIIFSPQPNQIYPVLSSLALLACWHAVSRQQNAWFFVSGGLMSISTFFSFANLIFFAPLLTLYALAQYQRYRAGQKIVATQLLGNLIAFGLGLSALWLAYWLYSGVTPLDIWAVAGRFHFGIEMPYWPWVWLNIQEFFYFGGWILAGLSLAALVQAVRELTSGKPIGNPHILTLVFWISLAGLDLSGTSEGEVSRVWSPYLPLLTLTAAAGLEHLPVPRFKFGLVSLALALNLIVTVGFIPRLINPELPASPALPPIQPAAAATPIDANFQNLAYLEGYKLTQTAVLEDGRLALEVTLNWRVLARFDRAYHVFVHVLAEDGSRVAQSDDIPARQGYPTTCWRPGQRLGDPHWLVFPPHMPPGDYRMQVGLFWLKSGERLAVYADGAPQRDFAQVNHLIVAPH